MTTPIVLMIILAIGLIWWGQGWIFPKFLLLESGWKKKNYNNDDNYYNSFRIKLALYLSLYSGITFYLAQQLHQSLIKQQIRIKPAVFILLWYPLGMQWLRYCHLLVVGPSKFIDEFGLQHVIQQKENNNNNNKWLRLFIRAAPIIIFSSDPDDNTNNTNKKNNLNFNEKISKKYQFDDDDDPKIKKDLMTSKPTTTRISNYQYQQRRQLQSILLDIVLIGFICSTVLILDLGSYLQDWIQRLLRVYIMGLSTSLIRLVHEYPIIKFCSNLPPNSILIIPLYDQPWLTKSPRELWRRWSVSAGYHLRKGFYEPLLLLLHQQQQQQQLLLSKGRKASTTTTTTTTTIITTTIIRLIATIVPFLVNTLMHIYWWSMGVKGEIDHIYWILLLIYPLLSFAMEDICGKLLFGGGETTTTTKKKTKHTTNNNDKDWCKKLHDLFNLLLLWIGFYFVGEPMAMTHGLNSDLTVVCRANLLLPP